MYLLRRVFYRITDVESFRKVESDFEYQVPSLQRLLQSLRNIQKMKARDGIDKLVFFFKILSPWSESDAMRNIVCDMKKIGMVEIKTRDNRTVTLEHLETLVRCIEYGAYNKYGMNRASISDEVSDDTVFVGGDRDISVLSIRKWRMVRYVNPMSFHIAQEMSNQYVEDHADPVVNILKIVVRAKPTSVREAMLRNHSPLAIVR